MVSSFDNGLKLTGMIETQIQTYDECGQGREVRVCAKPPFLHLSYFKLYTHQHTSALSVLQVVKLSS